MSRNNVKKAWNVVTRVLYLGGSVALPKICRARF